MGQIMMTILHRVGRGRLDGSTVLEKCLRLAGDIIRNRNFLLLTSRWFANLICHIWDVGALGMYEGTGNLRAGKGKQ